MGSSDDPYVDFDGRVSADSVELVFSEYSQQSGLRGCRHVANFVEKQGATVGLFESANAALIRACESAFLMSE